MAETNKAIDTTRISFTPQNTENATIAEGTLTRKAPFWNKKRAAVAIGAAFVASGVALAVRQNLNDRYIRAQFPYRNRFGNRAMPMESSHCANIGTGSTFSKYSSDILLPLGDSDAPAHMLAHYDLAHNLEIIDAFVDLSQASSNLNVPNGFTTQHPMALTYKCVPGTRLDSILAAKEEKRDKIETALAQMPEMMAAVALMHRNGIAHNAISPANLLLSSPSAKLVLFQFAYAIPLDVSAAVCPAVTDTTYVAPEILQKKLSKDAIDPFKRDTYALGATYLELIRGASFAQPMNVTELLNEVSVVCKDDRTKRLALECMLNESPQKRCTVDEAIAMFVTNPVPMPSFTI